MDKFGFTLTPDSGASAHSFNTWGCRLTDAPTYSSRQPKEIIVELPLSDTVLDFSRINNGLHFSESEVTYSFVFVSKSTSQTAKASDVTTKHKTIEDYVWNFIGSVKDDYMSGTMTNARCKSFTATPDIVNGVLTCSVTFIGRHF